MSFPITDLVTIQARWLSAGAVNCKSALLISSSPGMKLTFLLKLIESHD